MQNLEILFVDDERSILSTVKEFLSFNGYKVTVIDDSLKALELTKRKAFDVVFTDLKMPGFNGMELLSAIKNFRPETKVIMVTGYATIESAVEAMKVGCYDYLQKPIDFCRLKELIEEIRELLPKNANKGLKARFRSYGLIDTMTSALTGLQRGLKARFRSYGLIGETPKMQEIYRIIDRVSKNDSTVLIYGASGTGKELVAKVIHQNSKRRKKPFVTVNCGAIAEGLLESELFGHTKGAFTGAIKDKIGLFKAAEGGTIFLDEVTEMNPPLQVKLLRALQEKKVRPVGDIKESDVDVRVIAATNKDPVEAVKNGILRKDLFYRLNVVSIKMPLLKERKEDIPLLVNHFTHNFSTIMGYKKVTNVSPEAMDVLLKYDWPGNVRELENVIERAFALGVNETIGISDLPPEIKESGKRTKAKQEIYNLKENEIHLINKALQKTGGNKIETANLLGINIATLYRKIKRYNL